MNASFLFPAVDNYLERMVSLALFLQPVMEMITYEFQPAVPHLKIHLGSRSANTEEGLVGWSVGWLGFMTYQPL